MKFIFSFILVVLTFGFLVSVLFALGNNRLKERIFYLVMSVVLIICIFGTMYYQKYLGI